MTATSNHDFQHSVNVPTALRFSVRGRKVVDAIVHWLSLIAWQWFVTLTYPWPTREEAALGLLHEYIDRLEQFLGTRICVVAGIEAVRGRNGLVSPRHCHLLLISDLPISREVLEAVWAGLIRAKLTPTRFQEHIRALPCSADKPGIQYCLKSLGSDLADWHFHGLREYLPGLPGLEKPSHKTVRGKKRAEQRRMSASRVIHINSTNRHEENAG